MVIKDSLRTDEIKKKMLNAEMNYKLEKSEIINNAKLTQKDGDISKRKFFIAVILGVALLLIFCITYINQKKQKNKQRQFSLQLIQSQEEERKRVSKELHDGIGQNLLLLKNSYKDQIPLMEATIEDLRNISRNMHPVQLEKLGFKKAVESIISEAKKNSNILFTYEIGDVDQFLTTSDQLNLYRIVQECISNILKHSQTTAAKIAIVKEGNKIITSIYDKGKGFNIKEALMQKTLGLNSITERVALMSGKLNITSNDKGTFIEIILKHA